MYKNLQQMRAVRATHKVFPFFIIIFVFFFSLTISTGSAVSQDIHTSKVFFNDSERQETTACADCDYIIDPKQYHVDNAKLNLLPGATIGIKGQNRKGFYIKNFHGTEAKPFLFINCDGQSTITSGSVGIKIHESSHIRVTGTGSSDDYGIKISTALHGVAAEHGATDFEIDHVEISGSKSIGFLARSNPEPSTNRENFVQKNTLIHHNYIHNVRNEGLYVGGSHWHTTLDGLKEPELIGVRIYNNRVVDTGYDGIQVGSAIKDSEIYNNVVINYGLRNVTFHQSGIQANPGTTARIYNNYVKGGTGNAIFLNGFGNDVYNNLIVDCNKHGMYIKDIGPLPNKSYRIFNNTLINIGRAAVKVTSKLSVNNMYYNNVMINAAGSLENDSNIDFDIAHNFEANSAQEVFKDPEKLDFSPSQGSPLVDRGLDILNATDIDIEKDYLFNKRTSGASIDIGAIEFQAN